MEDLGFTDRITVIGHYAYVCSWQEGLLIYDVFDTSSPMLQSQTPAPADRMIDVCGDGRYAYVAAGTDGLLVLDVSDKTAPAIIAQTPTLFEAKGVEIRGHTCYVAETGGLETFDVSDPANPAKLGAWGAPGPSYDVSVDVAGTWHTSSATRSASSSSTRAIPSALGPRGAFPAPMCREVEVHGTRAYFTTVLNPDRPVGHRRERPRRAGWSSTRCRASTSTGSPWLTTTSSPATGRRRRSTPTT